MNSSDVHERRRITAAILKSKYGNSHGFQHHQNSYDTREELNNDDDDNDDDGDDDDDDGEVFIDSVQQQPSIHAAPLNRNTRFAPIVTFGEFETQKDTEHRQQQQQQQQFSKYSSKLTNRNSQHNWPKATSRHSGGPGNNLNTVIESSNEVAEANSDQHERVAFRPTRLQQRRTGAQQKQLQQHAKNHAANRTIAQCRELVDHVKRRLSLPGDTSIPNSFLVKHKDRLNSFNSNDPNAPLSRLDRRQSLYDIGFGQAATYSKLHVLGAGTYSIVYKGASRLTNRLVALKEIHLERDEGVPFTAIREVSLLKQLKHCNIITLHDIIYTNKTLTLVFEFVDRDLSRYMDECDHNINPANVKLFLFQLLRALSYCHARKILHRDIKPQNILISLSGELKLADFGLARAKSFPTKTYTDEVVTLWYRPPDVLLGNVDYGACIDMWGVGCIFFEMIAGFTLFLGTDPKKQICCIFKILGTPNELTWPGIKNDLEWNGIDISSVNEVGRDLASLVPHASQLEPSVFDLLERLLKCNPKLRISSNDALRHEYFASFAKEIYELRDSASIFSLNNVRLLPETHLADSSDSSGVDGGASTSGSRYLSNPLDSSHYYT